MDMKTNFALKKKRELLGTINKRKMSLRKYMDNLKQNESRLDITQITKYVFLGSLCLKPVPQLFDSPLLLEELNMKVGNTIHNMINDENVGESVQITNGKRTKKDVVKKATSKRKCLNSPKIKKKSLREKNESKNMYNNTVDANINNENVKLERNESVRLDEAKAEVASIANTENEITQARSPSPKIANDKSKTPINSVIVEPTINEPIAVKKLIEIQSDVVIEEGILHLKMLNQNNAAEEIASDKETSNSIPLDIKRVDIVSTHYEDEAMMLKREPTPELLLPDSDDDTIDQLMFNIMDIKIGPNVFDKEFFDMPTSDIDDYEEFSNKYDVKDDSPDIDSCTAKDKKFIRRTPQCKICSQVFSSYMKLKDHRMTHNGDKPYLCLKCSENHTTLDQLLAHLRTHQGKRPYVCKKCSKGFKTTKALENHQPVHVLRKVVAPKKTFKCEVCRKEFRKLCDLERHTRVHTGEKPSVCNICNRRFQQAHNLNKHLLIHTQEKPFQCDICNKKFGRNDVLNRHLLTHSVKKPNHCETCMKSFIRVSQLLAHKEKYHSK